MANNYTDKIENIDRNKDVTDALSEAKKTLEALDAAQNNWDEMNKQYTKISQQGGSLYAKDAEKTLSALEKSQAFNKVQFKQTIQNNKSQHVDAIVSGFMGDFSSKVPEKFFQEQVTSFLKTKEKLDFSSDAGREKVKELLKDKIIKNQRGTQSFDKMVKLLQRAVGLDAKDIKNITFSQIPEVKQWIIDERERIKNQGLSIKKITDVIKNIPTTDNKKEASHADPFKAVNAERAKLLKEIQQLEMVWENYQTISQEKGEAAAQAMLYESIEKVGIKGKDVEEFLADPLGFLDKRASKKHAPTSKTLTHSKPRYSHVGGGQTITPRNSSDLAQKIKAQRKAARGKINPEQLSKRTKTSRALVVFDTETTDALGELILPVTLGYSGYAKGSSSKISGRVFLQQRANETMSEIEATLDALASAMNIKDSDSSQELIEDLRKQGYDTSSLQVGKVTKDLLRPLLVKQRKQKDGTIKQEWDDKIGSVMVTPEKLKKTLEDKFGDDFDVAAHNAKYDHGSMGNWDIEGKLDQHKSLKKLKGQGSKKGRIDTLQKAKDASTRDGVMIFQGLGDGSADWVEKNILDVSHLYELFYGKKLSGAHGAKADAEAELAILEALNAGAMEQIVDVVVEALKNEAGLDQNASMEDLKKAIYKKNGSGALKPKFEKVMRETLKNVSGIFSTSNAYADEVYSQKRARINDSEDYVKRLIDSYDFDKQANKQADKMGLGKGTKEREDFIKQYVKKKKEHTIKIFTGKADQEKFDKAKGQRGFEDMTRSGENEVGTLSRSLEDLKQLAQENGYIMITRQTGPNGQDLEIGFMRENQYANLSKDQKQNLWGLEDDDGFHKAHIEIADENGFLSSGQEDMISYERLWDIKNKRYSDAILVNSAVSQVERLKRNFTAYPDSSDSSILQMEKAKLSGKDINIGEILDKNAAKGRQKNSRVLRPHSVEDEMDKYFDVDQNNSSQERQIIRGTRINYDTLLEQTLSNKNFIGLIQNIGKIRQENGNTTGYKFTQYTGMGSSGEFDITKALRKLMLLELKYKGDEVAMEAAVSQWEDGDLAKDLWVNRNNGEQSIALKQYLKDAKVLASHMPDVTGMPDAMMSMDAIDLVSAEDLTPLGWAIQPGMRAPTAYFNHSTNYTDEAKLARQEMLKEGNQRTITSFFGGHNLNRERDNEDAERLDTLTFDVGFFTQKQFDDVLDEAIKNYDANDFGRAVHEEYMNAGGAGVLGSWEDYIRQYSRNWTDKIMLSKESQKAMAVKKPTVSKLITQDKIEQLLKGAGINFDETASEINLSQLNNEDAEKLQLLLNKTLTGLAGGKTNGQWDTSNGFHARRLVKTQNGYKLEYDENFDNDKIITSGGQRLTDIQGYSSNVRKGLISSLGFSDNVQAISLADYSEVNKGNNQILQDVSWRKMFPYFSGRMETVAKQLKNKGLSAKEIKEAMKKGAPKEVAQAIDQMFEVKGDQLVARPIERYYDEQARMERIGYGKNGKYQPLFNNDAQAAETFSYIMTIGQGGFLYNSLNGIIDDKRIKELGNVFSLGMNLQDVSDYSGADSKTRVKSTPKLRNSIIRRNTMLGHSQKKVEKLFSDILRPSDSGRVREAERMIEDIDTSVNINSQKQKYANTGKHKITLRLLKEGEDRDALQKALGDDVIIIDQENLDLSMASDSFELTEEQYDKTLGGMVGKYLKKRGLKTTDVDLIYTAPGIGKKGTGKDVRLSIDSGFRDEETGMYRLGELERQDMSYLSKEMEIRDNEELSDKERNLLRARNLDILRNGYIDIIGNNKSALLKQRDEWYTKHSRYFKPEQVESKYVGDAGGTAKDKNTVYTGEEMFKAIFGSQEASDYTRDNADLITLLENSRLQTAKDNGNLDKNTKKTITDQAKDFRKRLKDGSDQAQLQSEILEAMIESINEGNENITAMLGRPPFIEGYEGQVSRIKIDKNLNGTEAVRMSEDLLKYLGGDTDGDQMQIIGNILHAKGKETSQKYGLLKQITDESDQLIDTYSKIEDLRKASAKPGAPKKEKTKIDEWSKYFSSKEFIASYLGKEQFDEIGSISNAGSSFAQIVSQAGLLKRDKEGNLTTEAVQARVGQSVLQIFEQEAISAKKLEAQLMARQEKIITKEDGSLGIVAMSDQEKANLVAQTESVLHSVTALSGKIKNGGIGEAMDLLKSGGYSSFDLLEDKQIESMLSYLSSSIKTDKDRDTVNEVLRQTFGIKDKDFLFFKNRENGNGYELNSDALKGTQLNYQSGAVQQFFENMLGSLQTVAQSQGIKLESTGDLFNWVDSQNRDAKGQHRYFKNEWAPETYDFGSLSDKGYTSKTSTSGGLISSSGAGGDGGSTVINVDLPEDTIKAGVVNVYGEKVYDHTLEVNTDKKKSSISLKDNDEEINGLSKVDHTVEGEKALTTAKPTPKKDVKNPQPITPYVGANWKAYHYDERTGKSTSEAAVGDELLAQLRNTWAGLKDYTLTHMDSATIRTGDNYENDHEYIVELNGERFSNISDKAPGMLFTYSQLGRDYSAAESIWGHTGDGPTKATLKGNLMHSILEGMAKGYIDISGITSDNLGTEALKGSLTGDGSQEFLDYRDSFLKNVQAEVPGEYGGDELAKEAIEGARTIQGALSTAFGIDFSKPDALRAEQKSAYVMTTDKGKYAVGGSTDLIASTEDGEVYIDYKASKVSSDSKMTERFMQLFGNKAGDIQRAKASNATDEELEKLRQASVAVAREYVDATTGKTKTEITTLTAEQQERILASFGFGADTGEELEVRFAKLIDSWVKRGLSNLQIKDIINREAFGGNGVSSGVTVYDENGQVDEQATERTRNASAAKINSARKRDAEKLAREYLQKQKEIYKYEGQLEDARIKGQGLKGNDMLENEKLKGAISARLSMAQAQLANLGDQASIVQALKEAGVEESKITQFEEKLQALKGESLIKDQQRVMLAREEQGFMSKIIGGFKQRITWFIDSSLAYTALGKVRQATQAVLTTVKQLDKAMVDLQIASGKSRSEIMNMMKDFNQLANKLGRTTQEVAVAANDWLRAGYNGQEATQLVKASMELSTLGMIDSASATQYLISTLKGWKIEANEVIGVVDKLTSVDMAAAISAGDLALAMSRSNNSARIAGSSMDNFIGYVTTVADVTQKSAESVGESFKTIYSRFGNVKAGKFIATEADKASGDYDPENFEKVNDIEKVLGTVGIKIRTDSDSWRNTDDILAEIGAGWKTWSQTTQNAVATAIAGTRQRENVITLFENWDKVKYYSDISKNSEGTAENKMEDFATSLEAAKNRVTVALEGLGQSATWVGNILKTFYKLSADFIGIFSDLKKVLALFGAAMIPFGGAIINGTTDILSSIGTKLMGGAGGEDLFSFLRDRFKSGPKAQPGENERGMNVYHEYTVDKDGNYVIDPEKTRYKTPGEIERDSKFMNTQKIKARGTISKMAGNLTLSQQESAGLLSDYLLTRDALTQVDLFKLLGVSANSKGEKIGYNFGPSLRKNSSFKNSQSAFEKSENAYSLLFDLNEQGIFGENSGFSQAFTEADNYRDKAQSAIAEYQRTLSAKKESSQALKALQSDPTATQEQIEAANKQVEQTTEDEIVAKEAMNIAIKEYTQALQQATAELRKEESANAGASAAADNSPNSILSEGQAPKDSMTAKGKRILGVGSAAGSMGGGFLVSTTMQSAGASSEVATMIGSMSAMVIPLILKGVAKIIPKIMEVFGVAVSAAGGALAAGIVGILIGAVAIGVAIWKAHQKKMLEEAQKSADEAQEAYKKTNGTQELAAQYDKLSKGVDLYGKNLTLTDQEYQEFLDVSNRLAEVYPELIGWTDEAGQAFLKLGSNGQSATEVIKDLAESLKIEAAEKAIELDEEKAKRGNDEDSAQQRMDKIKKEYFNGKGAERYWGGGKGGLGYSEVGLKNTGDNGTARSYAKIFNKDQLDTILENDSDRGYRTESEYAVSPQELGLAEGKQVTRQDLDRYFNNIEVELTQDQLTKLLEIYQSYNNNAKEFTAAAKELGKINFQKLYVSDSEWVKAQDQYALGILEKYMQTAGAQNDGAMGTMEYGGMVDEYKYSSKTQKWGATGKQIRNQQAFNDYTNREVTLGGSTYKLSEFWAMYQNGKLPENTTEDDLYTAIGVSLGSNGGSANNMSYEVFGDEELEWDASLNNGKGGWKRKKSIQEQIGDVVGGSSKAKTILSGIGFDELNLMEKKKILSVAKEFNEDISEDIISNVLEIDEASKNKDTLGGSKVYKDKLDNARTMIKNARASAESGDAWQLTPEQISQLPEELRDEAFALARRSGGWENISSKDAEAFYKKVETAQNEAEKTEQKLEQWNLLGLEESDGIIGLIDTTAELNIAFGKLSESVDNAISAYEQQVQTGSVSFDTYLKMLEEDPSTAQLMELDEETGEVRFKSGDPNSVKADITENIKEKVDIMAQKNMESKDGRLALPSSDGEIYLSESGHDIFWNNYSSILSALGYNEKTFSTKKEVDGKTVYAISAGIVQGIKDAMSGNNPNAKASEAQVETWEASNGQLAVGEFLSEPKEREKVADAWAKEKTKDIDDIAVEQKIKELQALPDYEDQLQKEIIYQQQLIAASDTAEEKNERAAKLWELKDKKIQNEMDILDSQGLKYSAEYIDYQRQLVDQAQTRVEKAKRQAELDDLLAGAIQNEIDSLEAYQSTINKDYLTSFEGGYASLGETYYDPMKKNLQQEIAKQRELVNQESSKIGTDDEKDYYNAIKKLQDLELQFKELDTQEVQDKIDLLNSAGLETGDTLKELYSQMIKGETNDKKRIEAMKKYNDLVEEEINNYKELLNLQLELLKKSSSYLSPNESGYTSNYIQQMQSQREKIKADFEEMETIYQNTYNEIYKGMIADGYSSEQADKEASKAAQLAYREKVSGTASDITEYGALVNSYYKPIIEELEKKEQEFVSAKPEKWFDEASINEYYDTIEGIRDAKKKTAEEALKNSKFMTDEEINYWKDKIKEANKEIAQDSINRAKDIQAKDEERFQYVKQYFDQIKNNLSEQKKLVEEMYDEEIKKLQDKKESIERTNKLIELQNNLLNAQNEKQRVYVEGVGWTYRQNRNDIKSAQSDIKDFYLQDEIDDLNNAKDAESKALQERIDNWDSYLKSMEERFKKQEQLQMEAAVIDLFNVGTLGEAYSLLAEDSKQLNAVLNESQKNGVLWEDIVQNFGYGAWDGFFNRVDENKALVYKNQISYLDYDKLDDSAYTGENDWLATQLQKMLQATADGTQVVFDKDAINETKYILQGDLILQDVSNAEDLFKDIANTMQQKSQRASK